MKFRYQRWMIKTSLVYLFVGVLLGLLIFLADLFPSLQWARNWRTVHVHLILMGSVIQMIMGVALWMFPRRREPPPVTSEREGMTLYVAFNAGTVIRSLFEPSWQSGSLLYFLTLSGMILQVLSILYFLYLILQRIRAPAA